MKDHIVQPAVRTCHALAENGPLNHPPREDRVDLPRDGGGLKAYE